ncbi:penicillin-binding protein activator LpoB [bacterium]|nr:penicillin-binding protein activator LpoB [bacterium]
MRPCFSLCLLILLLGACRSTDDRAGRPATYEAPGEQGTLSGVGIESQDLVGMTDQMMRDMLANPNLANAQNPPRIVVDSEYFRNESSTRIDKNLITDRLRINLNRAADGRMIFLGRHFTEMVEMEKERLGETPPDLPGADYRLGGRIATLDAVNHKTGAISRYHQITFEMVDLQDGVIIWSGIHEFRKSAQDDIIYR